MATPPEPAGVFRVSLPVRVLPIWIDELGSVTAIAGTAGEVAVKAILVALTMPGLEAVSVSPDPAEGTLRLGNDATPYAAVEVVRPPQAVLPVTPLSVSVMERGRLHDGACTIDDVDGNSRTESSIRHHIRGLRGEDKMQWADTECC